MDACTAPHPVCDGSLNLFQMPAPADGHLYELQYSTGDSWRSKRCQKVGGWLGGWLGTFLVVLLHQSLPRWLHELPHAQLCR